MHQEVENTIRPVLIQGAQEILLDMRGLTPVDTANVVHRLAFKVSPDGLTARIGLVARQDAREAFYFAFLDSGTKGNAEKNIPPQQALHIRERAFDANRNELMRRIKHQIDSTLARVAASA